MRTMTISRMSRGRQTGAVSILVVLALVALLGAIGIAIDSGLGYMVKAKLDAAADGAAIAAGQAVTRGADQATQTTNAQNAAKAFFAANYPEGFLNSTATLANPSVTFDQGTVTINVAATAQVPVTLMQVLGFKVLNVSTSSQAIRRDLDMAFIIDTTGSMATDPTVPPAVQSAATTFLQQFDPLTDRVSLMHFAYGTVKDVPFNGDARGFDRTTMIQDIDKYNFSGSTNSAEAYWNALSELMDNIKTPSSLRVIVFFSDGAPNSFASMFSTTPSSCGTTAGTVISGDTPNTPAGLYSINQQSTKFSGSCYNSTASKLITKMPTTYNAHTVTWKNYTAIPAQTTTPRVVGSAVTYANVNNAARNIAEALANYARSQNIYVYTIGRGAELLTPQGANNEIGEDILKCMANTPDSLKRCYNPAQPVGVYCRALTTADITPCFTKLASEILRISK
jgi:Flp pilus assembly protein TadG